MNTRPDHNSIAAHLHLESAARSVRAASGSLDAAAWMSPAIGRALDRITGLEFVQIALAAQIEALINAGAEVPEMLAGE